MDIFGDPVSSLSHNTTFSLVSPVMHFISSALLLGAVALQSVMGRPSNMKRDVDSFVQTETTIALEQLLCNIGDSGCHSSGVTSGLVIASPSKSDPDCK